MPHSGPEFKNMLTSILSTFPHPDVLDVGVGAGKTASLVPTGTHLVGIEAHEPYQKLFVEQWRKYARVRIGDAMNVSLELTRSRFDVVIMGDVLEHLWKHDALALVEFWLARSSFVICVWPNGFPQDDSGGAMSEIHRTELHLSDFAGFDVVRFHKHYRDYPRASKSIVVLRGSGRETTLQQGVSY
jgi:SAM-dependent methyltransferase